MPSFFIHFYISIEILTIKPDTITGRFLSGGSNEKVFFIKYIYIYYVYNKWC